MDYSFSNSIITENHSDLPAPLIFNCWKHHRGFIQRQIKFFAADKHNGLIRIFPKLLLIGSSQIDLYIGKLKEEEIAAEMIKSLQKLGVYRESEFVKWISSADGNFEMLKLSDGSSWTLRLGINKYRYIHIHPGRHTFASIRIRSNTLKTAILTHIFSAIENLSPFDLALINKTRTKSLGLAPIKSVERSTGLKELITLLEQIM